MALSLIWGSHFFVLIFEKSRSTNMLRILIPICLLLFSCKKEEIELSPFVHPDEVGLEKFYGGDQEDRANEIVVLNNELYVIGTTESFGEGAGDILLLKMDALGNELLQRTYGGPGIEEGEGIIKLTDNNLLLIASTESFGAEKEIWLIKIDAEGKEL